MPLQAGRCRRTWVRAMVVGSAVATTLLVTTAGARPATAAQGGAPCGTSFDPYDYSAAQVQACGYAAYSAQATEAPMDGGSAVQYQLSHGIIAKQLIPPAGFSPLAASAAQLEAYGFPPRPSGGPDLTQWQREMSGWRGSAPATPFLAVSPATTTAFSASQTSGNWGGYMIQSDSQQFTEAEGWFDEPISYHSVCSNPDESTWAGLGGWVSGDTVLAQNGTAINVPGIGNHQFWWEFYPYNNMVPIDLYANPGDEIDVSVTYLGDSGGQADEYGFWFYDYGTGQSDAFDAYISAVDLNYYPYGAPSYTAEFVIERPSVNNQLTELLNFGTLDVIASQANGESFNEYPQFLTNGLERWGLHMENYANGDPLATPSDISAGGEFTVTQNHCD
jgi:hypothetical protein